MIAASRPITIIRGIQMSNGAKRYLRVSGCVTVLVMFELSAAFDTLDHRILLHRFENLFGISGADFGWIASYLHDRYQVVVIDGEHSDPVLQGSVLGPKKYTMYSKPLGAIIRRYELCYHFYADDPQLYISFKQPKQIHSLELLERCLTDIWLCCSHPSIMPCRWKMLLYVLATLTLHQ